MHLTKEAILSRGYLVVYCASNYLHAQCEHIDVAGWFKNTKEVPLNLNQASLGYHCQLLSCLNSLRQDIDFQAVSRRLRRNYKSLCLRVGPDSLREAAIELYTIDRERPERVQRCVAGAEVIGCYAALEGVEAAQDPQKLGCDRR